MKRIKTARGKDVNGLHQTRGLTTIFWNRKMDNEIDDDDRHDQDPDNNDPPDIPDTLYPTKSPFVDNPTLAPSKATSPSTIAPTKSDGSLPTKAPTKSSKVPASPTKSPQPSQITSAPNKVSSTNAPTVKNSPSTNVPTTSKVPSTSVPTFAVSNQPTCVVDTSSGIVGNIADFQAVELKYVYEIYEIENSMSASMNGDIIPALEKEMFDILAPGYVSFGCVVSGRMGRGLAKESTQQVSTLKGISSKPEDKMIERSCEQLPESGSCTLVEGRMSMYVDGVSDGWALDIVGAIERGMQNNTFVGAHLSIDKIAFVCSDLSQCDFGPLTPSFSPPSDPPTESEGTPIRTGMMVLYVLAGVGSLISFAAFGRFARQRRRQVRDRGVDYEESLSSGVSIGSIKDLGDFDHSSAHDLDTVRVSNRELADDMEVNVDLESFESKDNEDDGCFDFFDLILEGSSTNEPEVRSRSIPQSELYREDDLSEISF